MQVRGIPFGRKHSEMLGPESQAVTGPQPAAAALVRGKPYGRKHSEMLGPESQAGTGPQPAAAALVSKVV